MAFRIRSGFLDLPPAPRPATGHDGGAVATIGNFDGAHLGHQVIFRRVCTRARESGALALAITFDPHPLRVLRPERAPRMILTRAQKIEILREAGFDELVFIPFDAAVAQVDAETFVRGFLIGILGLRDLSIGVDFRFGRGRSGDLALLQRIGSETGLHVESVPIVDLDGVRISASRIRDELAAGRVAAAGALMGRPYEAIGEVVHGSGRGRGQVAPTANLAVENELIPGGGVYVTETRLVARPGDPLAASGDGAHAPAGDSPLAVSALPPPQPGLTNIGVRPTFEDAGFAIENWMPDFTGDLYGRRLRVRFLERVRDERRFDSPEALRAQIARDVEVMRNHFALRARAGA